ESENSSGPNHAPPVLPLTISAKTLKPSATLSHSVSPPSPTLTPRGTCTPGAVNQCNPVTSTPRHSHNTSHDSPVTPSGNGTPMCQLFSPPSISRPASN